MSAQEPELGRIVRDYSSMVQGALLRLGVGPHQLEDAAQEVFLVLSRRFEEFDTQRSLASWLWGIARGVASTHRRSLRRRRRLANSVSAEPRREQVSLDDTIAQKQARDMLRAFLASLDEDKCAVFVLAEIEGCSGPEIAARLDVNLNTVYARLRAARRRFDSAAEEHRQRAAVASAWFGLRLGMPKVATASLSTVMAAAVVVPSMDTVLDPPRVHVLEVSHPKEAAKPVAATRKPSKLAKVQVERDAPPMPKTIPTLALAAALTAPVAVQAKAPAKKTPVSTSDQDADDAALVANMETREYIFDEDTVDGEGHGPAGENITARVSVHHQSLIRIRGHFISELITLATDI
ncbi:MAG: RNA polymerase sigma factor [Nannocystales bacterium]